MISNPFSTPSLNRSSQLSNNNNRTLPNPFTTNTSYSNMNNNQTSYSTSNPFNNTSNNNNLNNYQTVGQNLPNPFTNPQNKYNNSNNNTISLPSNTFSNNGLGNNFNNNNPLNTFNNNNSTTTNPNDLNSYPIEIRGTIGSNKLNYPNITEYSLDGKISETKIMHNISSIELYSNYSHEELRAIDYKTLKNKQLLDTLVNASNNTSFIHNNKMNNDTNTSNTINNNAYNLNPLTNSNNNNNFNPFSNNSNNTNSSIFPNTNNNLFSNNNNNNNNSNLNLYNNNPLNANNNPFNNINFNHSISNNSNTTNLFNSNGNSNFSNNIGLVSNIPIFKPCNTNNFPQIHSTFLNNNNSNSFLNPLCNINSNGLLNNNYNYNTNNMFSTNNANNANSVNNRNNFNNLFNANNNFINFGNANSNQYSFNTDYLNNQNRNILNFTSLAQSQQNNNLLENALEREKILNDIKEDNFGIKHMIEKHKIESMIRNLQNDFKEEKHSKININPNNNKFLFDDRKEYNNSTVTNTFQSYKKQDLHNTNYRKVNLDYLYNTTNNITFTNIPDKSIEEKTLNSNFSDLITDCNKYNNLKQQLFESEDKRETCPNSLQSNKTNTTNNNINLISRFNEMNSKPLEQIIEDEESEDRISHQTLRTINKLVNNSNMNNNSNIHNINSSSNVGLFKNTTNEKINIHNRNNVYNVTSNNRDIEDKTIVGNINPINSGDTKNNDIPVFIEYFYEEYEESVRYGLIKVQLVNFPSKKYNYCLMDIIANITIKGKTLKDNLIYKMIKYRIISENDQITSDEIIIYANNKRITDEERLYENGHLFYSLSSYDRSKDEFKHNVINNILQFYINDNRFNINNKEMNEDKNNESISSIGDNNDNVIEENIYRQNNAYSFKNNKETNKKNDEKALSNNSSSNNSNNMNNNNNNSNNLFFSDSNNIFSNSNKQEGSVPNATEYQTRELFTSKPFDLNSLLLTTKSKAIEDNNIGIIKSNAIKNNINFKEDQNNNTLEENNITNNANCKTKQIIHMPNGTHKDNGENISTSQFNVYDKNSKIVRFDKQERILVNDNKISQEYGEINKINIVDFLDDYQPVCKTLTCDPRISELVRLSKEELTRVSDFKVFNYYGKIEFLDDVDLTYTNLDDIIDINNLSFNIYKDCFVPKPYEKLNVPLKVFLYGIQPPIIESSSSIISLSNDDYEKKIYEEFIFQLSCELEFYGAKGVEYDMETYELSFYMDPLKK